MRRWLLALVLALAPPAAAQEAGRATLVADSVTIAPGDRLIASGHVEVFYGDQRLAARRIVYDRATDRLVIDGPITLTGSGTAVILADQADLSADLSEGLLTSARLVFERQLQLASSEILRVDGRYTRLGRTVASSCKVCAGSPTPLWEIRAARVIHDETARQLYFDRAQLRFGGVPVAYIPRLRIPDPSLPRATGFLLPQLRSSSGLGTGIKLPYFIVLGPSRDLTVTPYVSTGNLRSLDLRYRQAFRSGTLTVSGAAGRDALREGEARGYLAVEGDFALPRDWRLRFQGLTVSDRGYLRDYGISDADRLTSRIEIDRTRPDTYAGARLVHVYSIRGDEVNAVQPTLVGEAVAIRRIAVPGLGGTLSLGAGLHGHHRASTATADGDGNGIADGRDTARAAAWADWRGERVWGPGIVAATLGHLRADLYDISQDADYAGSTARLSGGAGVELRWPFVRATAGGATQVIEPVVQLLYAEAGADGAIPNEDSVLPEFDEASLFAFDRLPGSDAVEEGARANVGLTFTHVAPSGTSLALALGRIWRSDEAADFTAASGLGGTASDWLAALRLSGPGGMALTGRLVFDESLDPTKGELRLDYGADRFALASSYLWQLADAAEDRDDPVSELVLDGHYDLSAAWTAHFETRYDFTADRAAEAGLSLVWRNECLKVDLSLSRRFTSSTSVQPTTDVGLSVELLGFGGASRAGPARACRG
jgi:LPS-assembly protein